MEKESFLRLFSIYSVDRAVVMDADTVLTTQNIKKAPKK